jgi:hypothetical protein
VPCHGSPCPRSWPSRDAPTGSWGCGSASPKLWSPRDWPSPLGARAWSSFCLPAGKPPGRRTTGGGQGDTGGWPTGRAAQDDHAWRLPAAETVTDVARGRAATTSGGRLVSSPRGRGASAPHQRRRCLWSRARRTAALPARRPPPRGGGAPPGRRAARRRPAGRLGQPRRAGAGGRRAGGGPRLPLAPPLGRRAAPRRGAGGATGPGAPPGALGRGLGRDTAGPPGYCPPPAGPLACASARRALGCHAGAARARGPTRR